MKRILYLVLLAFFTVSLWGQAIVPAPTKMSRSGGALIIPEKLSYQMPAEFDTSYGALERWASEMDFTLKNGLQEPFLTIVQDSSIKNNEGYKLSTKDKKITIKASTDAGAFYALQTLRMLSDVAKGSREIPLVEIDDAPKFEFRSLMLDSSRHFQSAAAIKRLLEQMAILKLNKFHWHLVDNNGWRIPIKSYPELTEKGGFLWDTLEVERNGVYTEEEIREIVAYANALNIEVIPEIDIPGHGGAWAAVFPEFLCPTNRKPAVNEIDKRQGNFGYHEIFCMGNPKVFEFLETVFRETIELTGCKTIHVGGDEVEHGIWGKCPLCSEKMESLTGDKEFMMQKAFIDEICETLKKYNVKTINWLERPEVGVPNVNLTQVWRGMSPHHLRISTKAGVPTVVSFGEFAYFDYPDYAGTAKSKWMPVLSLQKVYNYRVVPMGYTKKQKEYIIGGECTLWTEEVLESQIDKMLFPRLLAFSEQMWSIDKNRKWVQFKKRYPLVQKQLEARGVEFSTPVSRPKIALKGYSVEAPTHQRSTYAEYGIDGDDTTAFVSARNISKGDHYTITFEQQKSLNRIEIITGGYYVFDAKNSHWNSGMIEISTDGSIYEEVGYLKNGQLALDLQEKPIKSIRIVASKDENFPMCVNEIRVY